MARQVKRNYAKETAWEDSPEQVQRREARNKVRRKAVKKYGKAKLKGKELDHVGFHPHGSLDKVPAVVVSRHKNRVRQPPHKGRNAK